MISWKIYLPVKNIPCTTIGWAYINCSRFVRCPQGGGGGSNDVPTFVRRGGCGS